MNPDNRQPASSSIDEEMIRTLVHGFYDRVRGDAQIGPIFNRVIAGDWEPHLAKMCDFWSSVMLTSGRYKGNPMMAHMRLKMVLPEHFDRWLTLFHATARDLFPHDVAEQFIGRADTIAHSLQLGMFFRPGHAAAASENGSGRST